MVKHCASFSFALEVDPIYHIEPYSYDKTLSFPLLCLTGKAF